MVGVETAFPLLYTYLVKRGVISLEKLIRLMAVNPRRRFGIHFEDEFTLWDLNRRAAVDCKSGASSTTSRPVVAARQPGVSFPNHFLFRYASTFSADARDSVFV